MIVVRKTSVFLLVIAYLGFISLGLPDAIAAVAWPDLREEFHLSQASFAWLFLGCGAGYFLSSFFAGRLTQLLGVGLLLCASSFLVSGAMFGYSQAGWFELLVACAVVWGLGSGGVDAALNHYAAGHFSARHMSWLHACYSTGATLGPLIMTACVVQAQSWRLGYGIVGATMLAMATLFAATQRRWADGVDEPAGQETGGIAMLTVLREPIVWMQIVVFFLYTGLENTAGQWTYTLLTESRGVSTETAGVLVGVYYGSIAAGRIVFGFIAQRVGLDRLVRLSTLGGIVGAACLAVGSLPVAALGLVVLGLGLASIFPTLMTRTPQRLGRAQAAHAIGFQVSAAMLGAATLPSLTGVAAQTMGLEAIGRCDLAIAAAIFVMHELLLLRTRSA
jgi:fucose permease